MCLSHIEVSSSLFPSPGLLSEKQLKKYPSMRLNKNKTSFFLSFAVYFFIIIVKKILSGVNPFLIKGCAFSISILLTGFSAFKQSSSTASFIMNCDSENTFKYFLLKRYLRLCLLLYAK